MFESAELGNALDKKTFNRQAPKIRAALLNAQKQLAQSDFSVVIIVSGVEGAGKPETVNLLLEWMDARGIETHAMWNPSDEERERPPAWRFWRVLPPRGRIGIFFGSWYTAPIIDRVFERTTDGTFEQSLGDIVEFERMLAKENVLLVKLWMHVSKKFQKRRLKELESDKKTRWRVSKMDWKFFKKYDAFRSVSEQALQKTSTGEAPWHIIESCDERYRFLTTTQTLLAALENRLALSKSRAQNAVPRKPDLPKAPAVSILSRLDMTQQLTKSEYEKKLLKYSGTFNLLTRQLYEKRKSLIAVFEGADAAGKGGAIRRLTGAMDARTYQVISVAAPTDEERARPYLWRFWRHLPRLGRVTIYDRSWYGRVLVERIEGFCATEDWQRAYAEINFFEEQIAEFGISIMKFWLAVTPDEQLRRFKDRETTPYKQYKLTEEDWRNRAKSGAYEAAACDMIQKTSTKFAPWVLVESNDKYWARIKVIKAVCDHLEQTLDSKE